MKSLQERVDYMLEKNIISDPVLRAVLSRSAQSAVQAQFDLLEMVQIHQELLNSIRDTFLKMLTHANTVTSKAEMESDMQLVEAFAWAEVRAFYKAHSGILNTSVENLSSKEKTYLHISI